MMIWMTISSVIWQMKELPVLPWLIILNMPSSPSCLIGLLDQLCTNGQKNGEVEQIPEVFSQGERSVAMARDEGDDEMDTDDMDEMLNIEANMTPEQANSAPATAKLQVQVLSQLYLLLYNDFEIEKYT